MLKKTITLSHHIVLYDTETGYDLEIQNCNDDDTTLGLTLHINPNGEIFTIFISRLQLEWALNSLDNYKKNYATTSD